MLIYGRRDGNSLVHSGEQLSGERLNSERLNGEQLNSTWLNSERLVKGKSFMMSTSQPLKVVKSGRGNVTKMKLLKFSYALAVVMTLAISIYSYYAAEGLGISIPLTGVTVSICLALPIFLRTLWIPLNRVAWAMVGSAVLFWGFSGVIHGYQKNYLNTIQSTSDWVFLLRINWLSTIAYLLLYGAVIILVKNQLAVKSRHSTSVMLTVLMSLSSILAWLVFFLNIILQGELFREQLPGFAAGVIFSTFFIALLFAIMNVGGLGREKFWLLLFGSSLFMLLSDMVLASDSSLSLTGETGGTANVSVLFVNLFWWLGLLGVSIASWLGCSREKISITDSLHSLIAPSFSLFFSLVLLVYGNFASIPVVCVALLIFSIMIGLVRFYQVAVVMRFSETVFSSSFIDTITPAWNDAYFSSFLKSLENEKLEGENNYAVLMINVTNLREVNETFGVDAGDELIRTTYNAVNDVLLDIPVVARLHGGKFAMFFRSKSPRDDALRKFNMLNEYLLEQKLTFDTAVVHPKIVGGTASWPSAHMKLRDVVHKANVAVNASVSEPFTFYTPLLEEKSGGIFLVEQLFQDSVKGERVVCHYQPKFNVATKSVGDVEALVRWEKGEGLFTPPSFFLPAVKKAGMDFDLFKKVLTISLEQVQRWRAVGVSLRVSVNVSLTEMREAGFVSFLAQECEKYGITCDTITLEVLENDDEDFITSDVVNIFNELNDMGVVFALDDFGSGKSTLGRLSELDFKEVKVDKELVENIHQNVEKFQKLQTLVKEFHDKGVLVVAEGVESEEEFEKVITAGCDYVQGYYVSAPMPAHKVELFVKNFNHKGLTVNNTLLGVSDDVNITKSGRVSKNERGGGSRGG